MAIWVHNERHLLKFIIPPPITKELYSQGGSDSHSTAKEKFKHRKVKITPKSYHSPLS